MDVKSRKKSSKKGYGQLKKRKSIKEGDESTQVDQICYQNVESKKHMKRQMLMDDHPTLFWTPCAAHCIDLMLHDICKLPIITTTVKRAIALNGYIYNHPYVLNMMRTFTEQNELIRPGVTRFATVFLTLQSIYNQKNKLRRMFTSEEWSTSRYHRDTKGKDAYETVLSPGFWNNILYSLRATGPLVRVLRMVDSEKKPAMGYIYEAMDRAKEAISKSFNYNEAKYYEIWEIIDKRWNDQLHRPLHAAGYYLNPEYFYTTPRIESNEELNDGFLKTMARLVPDEAIQHLVETELSLYRYARGVMGSPNAIRNRALWSPVNKRSKAEIGKEKKKEKETENDVGKVDWFGKEGESIERNYDDGGIGNAKAKKSSLSENQSENENARELMEGAKRDNKHKKYGKNKKRNGAKYQKGNKSVENEVEVQENEVCQISPGNEDSSKGMKNDGVVVIAKTKNSGILKDQSENGNATEPMDGDNITKKPKKAGKSKKRNGFKPQNGSSPADNRIEVQVDEVYQVSSGDEDCSKGMKKWLTEYHQQRPGLEILQQRIDEFIMTHEAQEEQARKEREAQAADGGWTVVVHHKGRKKTTDAESGITVGSVSQAAVMDKMGKKKKKVSLDLYNFQRREAQRNEIMMLQSKFEQDKKRIQQLRAARKFKPY